MARKKLFDSLVTGDAHPAAGPPPGNRSRDDVPASRPLRSMGHSLQELQKSSVQDIPIDQIRPSAIMDRIDVNEGIEDLVESFRTSGQEVPIKVRVTSDDKPYEVVVGRRRLAAAKALGWSTIRGFVTQLSDDELLLALGSENSARLDTSFIGRAQLAHLSFEEGYTQELVAKSLGVSQTLVNFMLNIYRSIGPEAIAAIGDAPGIGRGKWQNLQRALKESEIPSSDVPAMIESNMDRFGGDAEAAWSRQNASGDHDERGMPESTRRFEVLLRALQDKPARKAAEKPPSPAPRKLGSGSAATVRKQRELVIKLGKSATPELLDYLEERLEQLVAEYDANNDRP
ncbi:ParB/RepB/Spo0J family partition protein [Roseivivax halodurans]|nr:ParB/RepB/Spo0J family partition protein [Roseivivax halodurans]